VRTRRLAERRPFQVLQQRQRRALAGVEREVVEVVEHARLAQLAQLGVDIAAAQRRDDVRVPRLDGLGDAEGGIDRAREGHRRQHQRRAVAFHGLQRQALQRAVDQVRRRGQRLEGGLALRQLLGVAHELEARVDGVAQHVGQVVQVQRGQVARAVVQAQGAEGPGHGVAAVGVDVDVQRREARALGQEAAAADAVRQRGVTALQEGDGRLERLQVGVEPFAERCDRRAAALAGQRVDGGLQRLQPGGRQQFQDQRQRQVLLRRRHAARAQEAGEVGGRRIRRVQLRHRRDERQHTGDGGGDGHGAVGRPGIPGAVADYQASR
jgi:hypothetical protein